MPYCISRLNCRNFDPGECENTTGSQACFEDHDKATEIKTGLPVDSQVICYGAITAATLTRNDKYMAGFLHELLTENPWPTSDTRWQTIEVWAEQLMRRASAG